jgi:hypothetical protein
MKIVIDRDRDSYERELQQLRADNEKLRLKLNRARRTVAAVRDAIKDPHTMPDVALVFAYRELSDLIEVI